MAENNYEYVSRKNIKKESDHIQSVAKLLQFFQALTKGSEVQEIKKEKDFCSPTCYHSLKKTDLMKLNLMKHKLISPLARSLLKLGIQMFSY